MIQDFSFSLNGYNNTFFFMVIKSQNAAIYGLVSMSLSLFYAYMSSSDYESIDIVPDIFG